MQKEQVLKILLMGPQGSGKGTQAEQLQEKLRIPTLSMGQLIRDEIAAGSDLGKKMKSNYDKGKLASDKDTAFLLKRRLDSDDINSGYILDGYPRDMSQYKEFNFDKPTHVIIINIPKHESLKRLGNRLTCDKTGKVYSMLDGFKAGGACPSGGKLFVRDDDTPEAIATRLKIYATETSRVLVEYEKRNLVQNVDGVGSIEEVTDRILDILI
jgi:adenylate kinase